MPCAGPEERPLNDSKTTTWKNGFLAESEADYIHDPAGLSIRIGDQEQPGLQRHSGSTIRGDYPLNEKSILITGASDGLGKALAWELASRGYALALTARRLEKLEQLQQALQERYPGVQVEIAAMDVSRTDEVYDIVLGLKNTLGKLDIVFANAGIAYAGKIGKSPLENHLQVIETNVNGAIATLDAGIRLFREQGFGHLVGTSSVAAYRGFPRNAAYCASKAALSTFMEALRAETTKENIAVTVLHPGYIDTDINRALANRPFLIDAKKGARMMADLIEKRVSRSTVPAYPWALLAPILRVLPTSVIAKM